MANGIKIPRELIWRLAGHTMNNTPCLQEPISTCIQVQELSREQELNPFERTLLHIEHINNYF